MKECKFCGKEFISSGRKLYCSKVCCDKFWKNKLKEHYKDYNKKYYKDNRDYFRNHWQNYYQEHREHLIQKSIAYHDKHKDKFKKLNNIATRKYKNKTRFSNNRNIVLERDNHACQICGKSPVKIIHHIDGISYHNSDNPNNNLDNLTTLCSSCHTKIHHNQGDFRKVSTPSSNK